MACSGLSFVASENIKNNSLKDSVYDLCIEPNILELLTFGSGTNENLDSFKRKTTNSAPSNSILKYSLPLELKKILFRELKTHIIGELVI